MIARFAVGRRVLGMLMFFWLGSGLRAAPEVKPFPLSDALTRAASWTTPEFLAAWSRGQAGPGCVCRTFQGASVLFGRQPQAVLGWFEDGRLTSITVLFLDSGAWFGYVPDAQAKAVAQTRGPAFAALYRDVAGDVTRGMAGLAGNAGREVTVGEGLLRRPVRVFQHGDFFSRLTTEQDQLVKLSIFPTEEAAVQLLTPERRAGKKDGQVKRFSAQSQTATNGDRIIPSVPVIPQGDRAYCGVSTLAMVMRYLGVALDTEDYAAAAGIRFGSTAKAKIKEVYDAAGDTAEVRLPKTTQFDFAKARTSIDAGMPVVVFRRWSQERDFLHSAFARRFAENPTVELPKADLNDRKLWPTRESYAHASVVNGYNAVRREVIFTESWGESVRNRRMRVEELEGTTYLAYYPHF